MWVFKKSFFAKHQVGINLYLLISLQCPKIVNDHVILYWDIPAFNGILHIIKGPLIAPPMQVNRHLSVTALTHGDLSDFTLKMNCYNSNRLYCPNIPGDNRKPNLPPSYYSTGRSYDPVDGGCSVCWLRLLQEEDRRISLQAIQGS